MNIERSEGNRIIHSKKTGTKSWTYDGGKKGKRCGFGWRIRYGPFCWLEKSAKKVKIDTKMRASSNIDKKTPAREVEREAEQAPKTGE